VVVECVCEGGKGVEWNMCGSRALSLECWSLEKGREGLACVQGRREVVRGAGGAPGGGATGGVKGGGCAGVWE